MLKKRHMAKLKIISNVESKAIDKHNQEIKKIKN